MTLNLENFESGLGRLTPVVLSSPTSLDVCAHLQIKPIELVYRNLEEYEETYCDYPLTQVYEMYEQDETKRQEKLLKCREFRKSALKAQSATAASSRSRTAYGPSKRYASSAALDNYRTPNPRPSTSDTESTDGNPEELNGSPLTSEDVRTASRSVPDLTRENLDFRKLVTQSPRQHCPCQVDFDDDGEIISNYLRRYGDIISTTDISLEDRKIMERLILKKGRELEWEKRSQDLRKCIENDRIQRNRENQMLNQKWHDRLAEKRHRENEENARRYLLLEEKWKQHRKDLQTHLEERDKKVQNYLEELNYKKRKHLLEKQRQEAKRQLEVGNAIEKLMEEDRQQKHMMREKFQKRMKEAELRKRRKEHDYMRHVAEMNRMEDIKRSLKLEHLEHKTQEAIEELRTQIEEKELRAKVNYLTQMNARTNALFRGSGTREMAMEKARVLHSELLKGLEEWHKKVLDLQVAAQHRAGIKYTQQIDRRRARVASERILREERSTELLKRVHELDEKRKELVTSVIQHKDHKTAKHKEEKERKVQISRIRAQNAAELRQAIKEKIDPQTFDKKAARAELEVNFMRKSPSVGVSFNLNPMVVSGKGCTCSRC